MQLTSDLEDALLALCFSCSGPLKDESKEESPWVPSKARFVRTTTKESRSFLFPFFHTDSSREISLHFQAHSRPRTRASTSRQQSCFPSLAKSKTSKIRGWVCSNSASFWSGGFFFIEGNECTTLRIQGLVPALQGK